MPSSPPTGVDDHTGQALPRRRRRRRTVFYTSSNTPYRILLLCGLVACVHHGLVSQWVGTHGWVAVHTVLHPRRYGVPYGRDWSRQCTAHPPGQFPPPILADDEDPDHASLASSRSNTNQNESAGWKETQRKVEQQQQQIDLLLQLVQQQQSQPSQPSPQSQQYSPRAPAPVSSHEVTATRAPERDPEALSPSTNGNYSRSVPSTDSIAPATANTGVVPLKAMLFIDGTWLYYSIYERTEARCPIIQRYGRGWQNRYDFHWAALPRILCESLRDPGWSTNTAAPAHTTTHESATKNARPMEIVRASVFTSYKADTPTSSFRYQMFQDMQAANYDVHMMETVGRGEKCVDIQLAVEMMHYATVPNAYDVALLLTGDKDFMPAMIRTRQKARKVGLVSMKTGCNRALYETPGLKDYDVVWLEDHLDELIVPKRGKVNGSNHVEAVVSVFTLMKILYDFVTESGLERVTSRDIGRYLKILKLGSRSVLEELKLSYGGLRQFLTMSGVFVIETRDDHYQKEDPSDKAYWVRVRLPEATVALTERARSTRLSAAEKDFLETYSLTILQDKATAYYHSLLLLDTLPDAPSVSRDAANALRADGVELPDDLTRDYSLCKVAELKDCCRARGLPIGGTKAVLVDRIRSDVEQEIARLQTAAHSSPRKYQHLNMPHLLSDPSEETGTTVSDEADTYLKELVFEYLRASHGQASSRNVGRYLASNKSSTGEYKKGRQSALHELKAHYGGLASFVGHHDKLFERQDTLGSDNDPASTYEFGVGLRKGA
jgi:hypothetical protein